MPSVSTKQANFMAWMAHDPAAAKKMGVKQSVAKEFNDADTGKGIIGKKPGQAGYKLVRKKKR